MSFNVLPTPKTSKTSSWLKKTDDKNKTHGFVEHMVPPGSSLRTSLVRRLQTEDIEELKSNLFSCSTPMETRTSPSNRLFRKRSYEKLEMEKYDDIPNTQLTPLLSEEYQKLHLNDNNSEDTKFDGIFVNPLVRNIERVRNILNNSIHFTEKTEDSSCKFEREFVKLATLGSGNSGSTALCLNKLDGCVYAIKKRRSACRANVTKCDTLNELRIIASLTHGNILRYYSSWLEDNTVYLVAEYCDGGSVQNMIYNYRDDNQIPNNLILVDFICQLARALHYIHQRGVFHMDLKPTNILMRKNAIYYTDRKHYSATPPPPAGEQTGLSSSSAGLYSSIPPAFDAQVNEEFRRFFQNEPILNKLSDLDLNYIRSVYKLADFDHSFHSQINNDIEEGDSRYMPEESLVISWPPSENINKIDIFSLGFCVIDLLRDEDLPKDGSNWRELRNGISNFAFLPPEMNRLLMNLCHKNPCERPSASEILNNEYLIKNLRFKQISKQKLKSIKQMRKSFETEPTLSTMSTTQPD